MRSTYLTCSEHERCQVALHLVEEAEQAHPAVKEVPPWAQAWLDDMPGYKLIGVSHVDNVPDPDKKLHSGNLVQGLVDRVYRLEKVSYGTDELAARLDKVDKVLLELYDIASDLIARVENIERFPYGTDDLSVRVDKLQDSVSLLARVLGETTRRRGFLGS